MEMEECDLSSLEKAVALLEQPGFAVKLLDYVGKPIEYGLKKLPPGVTQKIEQVTKVALEKAFVGVLATMDSRTEVPANPGLHKILVTASGGVGGLFGLTALAVELPVSTAIILRSIADIARQEGENVQTPESQLACLEVFAFGGNSQSDDAADSAYFAARMALAAEVTAAARFCARQGARTLSKEAGPPVVRLISHIASRFGVVVTEKSAAQLLPVIGAVGGASINLLFINHYQDMANGHFVVRRLERKYGSEIVKEHYDRILNVSCV